MYNAMQANTVPATFWAVAFLLLPEHQQYKQQVLHSVQQPVAGHLPLHPEASSNMTVDAARAQSPSAPPITGQHLSY